MTARRALVTGGTGFIGSRLVCDLLGDGWDVHLLTRATSSLGLLGEAESFVTHHRIPSDPTAQQAAAAVAAALEESDPHVVFHLAILRRDASVQDMAEIIDANVRLPMLLAGGLARRRGRALFVGSASYMQRGGSVAPSFFSATRAAADPVLEWAAAHGEVASAILSLTSVYGPSDSRDKVVAAVCRAAATGEPLELVDTARELDLVHVADVSRAYRRAAELLLAGTLAGYNRFDVSSGTTTTLADLVGTIEQVSERTVAADWGARPARASDTVAPPQAPDWLPGWTPTVTLVEGLRDVWAAYSPDFHHRTATTVGIT